jgi:formate dehydrogenase iron-sulfur subunit
MDIKGPMPQFGPKIYFPSLVEWGISIGLIAATIFLFGLAARLVPILPPLSLPTAAAAQTREEAAL